MKRTLLTVGAVGVAMVATPTAPAAHADQQSFLDAVRHGSNPLVGVLSDESITYHGYRACRDLRDGIPPDAIVGASNIYFRASYPEFINISQHELCPDTLGSDR